MLRCSAIVLLLDFAVLVFKIFRHSSKMSRNDETDHKHDDRDCNKANFICGVVEGSVDLLSSSRGLSSVLC